MRAIPAVLFAAALLLSGQEQRKVVYNGLRCEGEYCLSFWLGHGYVFHAEDLSRISTREFSVWNPEGRLAYDAGVRFPDGEPGYATNASADSDGVVAVSASNDRRTGMRGGILLIDRNGEQKRFIDTGRFVPAAICFAEDHSIWVGGEHLDPTGSGEIDGAGIVRHYLRDGTLIGEFIARSSFPSSRPSGLGVIFIAAARDRIALITFPGFYSDASKFVELDLEGNEVGRWSLRREDTLRGQYAFTTDARLFQSLPNQEDRTRFGLRVFDRRTSHWLETNTVVHAILMGADGNYLVYFLRDERTFQGDSFIWIAAPK